MHLPVTANWAARLLLPHSGIFGQCIQISVEGIYDRLANHSQIVNDRRRRDLIRWGIRHPTSTLAYKLPAACVLVP
jgi:hypothetical protein